MKAVIFAAGLSLFLIGCGDSSQLSEEQQAEQNKAISKVNIDDVKYHVEVLGDDALEGREAGTRGYDTAAKYVALQYKEIGLKSFYGEGNYFQPIKFVSSTLDVDSAKLTTSNNGISTTYEMKNDFIMGPGFGDTSDQVSAPLVFVGFGITSPENEMDNYEGVDVNGKIAVMVSGAPKHFSNDQRAYYSRTKTQTAVENGAVGIITIRSLTDQERRDFSFYFSGLDKSGLRWVNESGQAFDAYEQIKVSATLSQKGAEKLFANSEIPLEQILADAEEDKTQSFEMDISANMSRNSNHSYIMSDNVVGYIEGSDPELKNEYVVYGAHLDHIGIRPGKNGDNIHNGVFDNAVGIATMLETAKIMNEMETKPKRSVLFVSYTAEEQGLRGSSYFVNNPPVPASQLAANINIDMPILTFPTKDIVPIGAEHSSLMSSAQKATAAVGVSLSPDPMPEEVIFVRSDQFSFIKAGIPAIYLDVGYKAMDPRVDGLDKIKNFLKNHYHQSSDDLNLSLNKLATENYTKTVLLIGLNVANDDVRPTWNEGNFFGEKFAK